jgi:DNA-binding GntR family transcriptional regulator
VARHTLRCAIDKLDADKMMINVRNGTLVMRRKARKATMSSSSRMTRPI